MKDNKVIKTICWGFVTYIVIILFFASLNYLLDTVQFSIPTTKPTFWDCIYYSSVTFGTIGYGDILASNTYGKLFVILQSIISIIFVGIFGGYIAYQFLKRPKNIHLTKYLFIRNISNNIYFSARVGNKGNDLINCTAHIEIIQINNNIKHSNAKKEVKCTILEESWYFDIHLNPKENEEFQRELKLFFNKGETSSIRILVIGLDIETGETVAVSRYYKVKDVKFGGKFKDLYPSKDLKTTKPQWDNLNMISEISEEEIAKIKMKLEIIPLAPL